MLLPSRLRTMRGRTRGVVLAVLIVLAGPALGVTFSQDFNSVRLPRTTDQVHPYPTWSVQTDGRIWYDVSFTSQGPDSSVCLVLRASTVDPGMTDAAVRLRLDLRGPDSDLRYLVEQDAVLQWDWWVRDNRLSEAVGVRLIYVRGNERETREYWNTPFYTPSDGFGPVLVWDCQRLDLADLHTPCEDPDLECIELEALEIELRGPVSQEVRLDNIYLGPRAGVQDCGEARTPGFVIMKLQSYAAGFADLDRDGRWDVLLPGFLGRPAQLWPGRATQLVNTAADHDLARYLGDLCLFLDVDNDGDQDLVLARVEREGLEVLENRGHGRFAAEPRFYPTRSLPVTVSGLAAGDVDGDGWLDVYIAANGGPDALLFNDGHGGFQQSALEPATLLAGRGVANGAVISDIDQDGDQDIIVSGSGLLINNGEHGFVAHSLDITTERRPMIEGTTVADLDGDGYWDLYLGIDQDSCRRPYSGRNLLFWGDRAGGWRRDRRSSTIVAHAGHCEGVAAADFNNDGHLDLFIGNRSGPSLCLLGTGGGEFVPDHGQVFGPLEITDLYGLCAVDRDGDGDQDVFVVRKHSEPVYLENRTTERTFLTARLLGVTSNWDAIGARAELTRQIAAPDSFRALREVRASNGYQLGGPRELHFGLPGPGPYRLTVVFPSGQTVVREDLEVGDRVVIVETDNALVAAWHRWRRLTFPHWSAAMARWPLPVQHLLLAALASALALVWSPTLRRLRLGAWRPTNLPVGLVLLILLVMAVRHHVGWHRLDAWPLTLSLPMGAMLGASLPSAMRYLRRQRTPLTIWDRLNEELISYTHTGWCKNLESLIRQGGMLAGDLDPGDRAALLERWQAAYNHFYSAVLPKLSNIAELGTVLDPTRPMGKDLDAGLRRMVRVRKAGPEEIAAGARDLRLTADRLAAVVEARLSCRVDLAMRTAWRVMAPELEEQRLVGELDLEAITGLRARIREHELVMVLQDLLRNAVDAATSAAEPTVRLTARADLRRVCIEIHDNGPGLAGRDPQQLLQAGYTTKTGGTGYGLSHAARILGIYRATLNLVDHTEGGLVVTINLMRPLHTRGDLIGAPHE